MKCLVGGLGVAPSAFKHGCRIRFSSFVYSRKLIHRHLTCPFPLFSSQISPVPAPRPSSPPPPSRFFSSSLSMASSSTDFSVAEDLSVGANDEVDIFQLIRTHEEKAAKHKLPPVEEARTVLNHSLRGVLSTFSKGYEGYPSGSMVDFACDADGSPLLAVSSLAVHTRDLLANPKCSLLVAKDPEDRSDIFITVLGDAVLVSETERETIRTTYLAKFPNALWVDFGDFQFMRIELKVVRYLFGVASAGLRSEEFSKKEFSEAKVDPIYEFSKPISSHMNKDHGEDTKLIVQHATSILVDSAYMLDVDSLGFYVKGGYQGQTYKLRIPFTRRASGRKDVKTLIVEMLEAAKTVSK